MLRRVIRYATHHDPRDTLKRALCKIVPERARCFREISRHLAQRRGLEIGGPTPLFEKRGCVPVYPIIGALDNVNFSVSTVWEGALAEGQTFRFAEGRRQGQQFIREAARLKGIADDSYDVVLSSHVIEHLANPIGGLCEWLRVVRPGGALLLVVPHRDGTFDRRRPVTTLDHLIADYQQHMGEDDLTHLPEILELHDLERDPAAGTCEQFRERSQHNFTNRCLHHHVFDTQAVGDLLGYLNLRIVALEPYPPLHIVALAVREQVGTVFDNERFTGPIAAFRRTSPFVSDHGDE
jgi:SAM-dependent methyltransferase